MNSSFTLNRVLVSNLSISDVVVDDKHLTSLTVHSNLLDYSKTLI